MNRFLGFLVIFLLLASVASAGVIHVIGSGVSVAGWSTDFVDCTSGQVDDQTGWGTNLRASNNDDRGNDFDCASGTAYRGDNPGVTEYLIADHSPADADYSVEMEAKVNTETSAGVNGPGVRLLVDGTGLTGYSTSVDADGNTVDIYKWSDGTPTAILDDDPITNVDWTTFQTIKLTVSGSATTTLTFYIEGSPEATVDDSSSPITAKNQGGILSYCSGSYQETYDDYAHID